MIIVRLIGGVGNQLFQYSAGMSLAHFHQVQLKLDITGFDNYRLHDYCLDNFKITAKIATNEDLRCYVNNYSLFEKFRLFGRITKPFLTKKNYLKEKSFTFDPNFFSFPSSSYLEGYWQSEKYFLPIEGVLRKEFVLKTPIAKENSNFLSSIRSSNSVAVHVRRGDYFSNAATKKIHGVLPINYYTEAVNYLNSAKKNLIFYIFSDDIEWCEKNLSLNANVVYVKTSKINGNFSDDFRLMSLCKHNIIANSTFSWWAAWLNSNSDKIIVAPKLWFRSKERSSRDIIPSNWVILG